MSKSAAANQVTQSTHTQSTQHRSVIRDHDISSVVIRDSVALDHAISDHVTNDHVTDERVIDDHVIDEQASADRMLTPIGIEQLFHTMLDAMGPTGWWPAETDYEIMVGAVLIQNASWCNAERSLDALRAADALKPRVIASMDNEQLQQLIRPSGFFRNKSRALQEVTRWYLNQYDSDPHNAHAIPDEQLRAQMLNLFGIGGETADDLLLYVFNRRTFIADTYSRRLFRFLGYSAPDRYAIFREQYQPIVLASRLTVADLQEFHGLIDEYGKIYRDDAAKADSFLGEWGSAKRQ